MLKIEFDENTEKLFMEYIQKFISDNPILLQNIIEPYVNQFLSEQIIEKFVKETVIEKIHSNMYYVGDSLKSPLGENDAGIPEPTND